MNATLRSVMEVARNHGWDGSRYLSSWIDEQLSSWIDGQLPQGKSQPTALPPPSASPLTIWVSGLIPDQGSELYEGIRLAVSASELEAYTDLNEWLPKSDRVTSRRKSWDDSEFIVAISDALTDSDEVLAWNVERLDLAQAVKA